MDKLNLTGARELLARLRGLPEEIGSSPPADRRAGGAGARGPPAPAAPRRAHRRRPGAAAADRPARPGPHRRGPRHVRRPPGADGPAVFVHIGLPKTGTSYLQTILWSHRDELAGAGMLVPGRERRDHLWASLVVREDPRVARRNPRAPQAWQVLVDELADWDRDGVISHEFFCSASAEQARRMVDELAPAEVHVVVTAREPLGLFTSSWQESPEEQGHQPDRGLRADRLRRPCARSGTGARSTSAWSSSAGATSSRPTGCT